MQCECLDRVKKNITEAYSKELGMPVEAINYSHVIVFEKPSYVTVGLSYGIKANKAGYKSQKGKLITVTASFCPFCGVAINPDKKE